MSEVEAKALLPLSVSMSSSKTRYGGRHNSLSLYVGGFSIGWLDANGDRWQEVHSLLVGHGKASSTGHSGSKYTIDPKHSWSGYNLSPEASDHVMKALFGTTVKDELNRTLAREEWVLFKGAYCLPREKLNRFIASRCIDRTWCNAVRVKEMPTSVADHIRSIATAAVDDDFFGEVRSIKAPSAPHKERMRWRCEDCGHEGHVEAFKARYLPGLATSTGLNCPDCDYRTTKGINALLSGPTRGDVRRLPSRILYPEV